MVIVVPFSQRDQRHPPTVPTGIGLTVGLTSPQVTDGIDAERRVQHQKDPPDTGQQEATHAAYPAVVGVSHEKRQRQTGQDDGDVPAVLPHHHAILAQPGRVSFGLVRAFREDPAAVAVPESSRRVVGVYLLVHARMVPSMIGAPFQRRVLQRPAARDQERRLDPVGTSEAAMGNHPVVPHGDPQSADEIEDAAHRPVQPRIAMDITEERHRDKSRQRDQREQRCRRDSQRSSAVLCACIQVMTHNRTLLSFGRRLARP